MNASEFRQHLETTFILTEATLCDVVYNGIGNLTVNLEIWEGNLTANYTGDFHADFPHSRLSLLFEIVTDHIVDRKSSYSSLEQLIGASRALSSGESADHGARTVFSWGFEPPKLEGRFGSERIMIETMDSLILIEFIQGRISGTSA